MLGASWRRGRRKGGSAERARSTPAIVLAPLAVALFVLVLFPEAAAACPVCFDSSEENRLAFLGTTIFLSLLPLGMVAGAGLWIRRRARERGDDEVEIGPDRPEP